MCAQEIPISPLIWLKATELEKKIRPKNPYGKKNPTPKTIVKISLSSSFYQMSHFVSCDSSFFVLYSNQIQCDYCCHELFFHPLFCWLRLWLKIVSFLSHLGILTDKWSPVSMMHTCFLLVCTHFYCQYLNETAVIFN